MGGGEAGGSADGRGVCGREGGGRGVVVYIASYCGLHIQPFVGGGGCFKEVSSEVVASSPCKRGLV